MQQYISHRMARCSHKPSSVLAALYALTRQPSSTSSCMSASNLLIDLSHAKHIGKGSHRGHHDAQRPGDVQAQPHAVQRAGRTVWEEQAHGAMHARCRCIQPQCRRMGVCLRSGSLHRHTHIPEQCDYDNQDLPCPIGKQWLCKSCKFRPIAQSTRSRLQSNQHRRSQLPDEA